MLFNFIKKHCGFIMVFVIIFAFIAPIIFTLPGFICFNESTTGQIGDTIGGITAPFLGFISILFLYLTLKEQQNFNGTQQIASDFGILMQIKDNISRLSNNLHFTIKHSDPAGSDDQGILNIEELRKLTNPKNFINIKDFDKLYKDSMEIAELILLFCDILEKSSLNVNIKGGLYKSVKNYTESIFKLYNLYKTKNIRIILTSSTMGDDPFSIFSTQNDKLWSELKAVLEDIPN